MSVARVKTRVERNGRRGAAAVNGATTRGAAYAKAQVSDLATRGRRLARDVDGQIKQATGRRSAAWIDEAALFVDNHRWTALALAGLAVYVLLALLV